MKKYFFLICVFSILFSYNVFASDFDSMVDLGRLNDYIEEIEEEEEKKVVLQDTIGYIVADNEQMEDINDFEENNTDNSDIETSGSEFVNEYRIIIIYALGVISGFLMSLFMLKWVNK